MRLAFFLEDIAHEKFVVTLALRILYTSWEPIAKDIRNATGGDALGSYKRFLRDYKRGREAAYDLLIVASDGNCTGPSERRRRLEQQRTNAGYEGTVIYAIPNPHIERWYLVDPVAVSKAADVPVPAEVPAHKCEKSYYKTLLWKAFTDGGIRPLSGGTEFGDIIAQSIDLDRSLRKQNCDEGLRNFIGELKHFKRQHYRSTAGDGRT